MKRVEVGSQYRWTVRQETPAPVQRMVSTLSVHPILAQVLAHRKVEKPEDAKAFLAPTLSQLPDPSSLPDFEAALATIDFALESGQPVLIHGDYDVDGMSGTALLYRLFKRLRHPVEVFLPNRFTDGYSFGEHSLKVIEEKGAGVVIAVDNGTTAYEPLQKLADRGVKVIVVDHHSPGDRRPECAALVNPWFTESGDGFTGFCGAGVAYLLAWGVLRHRHGGGKLPEGDRRFLIDMLGLAALATIADVMPLKGPNRALVTKGLQSLAQGGMPGLRALAASSGVRGLPTATDLGFRIAPRLNAAGRLGKAEVAFALLCTDSEPEANKLAAQLEAMNTERREIERREFEAFLGEAEARQAQGDKVLFLGRRDAHFGVLGIVANRLLDATGLPTLLWAECEPGIARGSARAPEGANLVELLEAGRGRFASFGGHARAAGFVFDPKRADEIDSVLREAAASTDPQPPELLIDAQVEPAHLSRGLVQELERLEPCGEANSEPVFLACDLEVTGPPKALGDGTHATIQVQGRGESVRVLGWRKADRLLALESGEHIDVVFHAGINSFRGRRTVEWTLLDFRTTPQS